MFLHDKQQMEQAKDILADHTFHVTRLQNHCVKLVATAQRGLHSGKDSLQGSTLARVAAVRGGGQGQGPDPALATPAPRPPARA
jgi:hypothetical protein